MKRLKSLVLTLLAMCLIVLSPLGFSSKYQTEANAQEVASEGLSYTLITESGVEGYAVSIGDCDDENVVIPATYEGKAVLRIAEDAFYGSDIESVFIPASVVSIYNSAFASCRNLSVVTIEEGSNLYSIGDDAFYDCRSLIDITIPANVSRMGSYAFASCFALTIKCVVPSQPTSWNSMWKGTCPIVWSCNTNEVANDKSTYAFVDGMRYAIRASSAKVARQPQNFALESVDIPATITYDDVTYAVESVGEDAFADCTGVKYVTISDGITEIAAGAFRGCTSLVSVDVPQSVQSIKAGAFNSCERLESIAIPEGITEIAESAFSYCYSLNSINLPTTLNTIGESAFTECKVLENVTFPSGVTTIGAYAFSSCYKLRSLTFSDSLSDIGPCAFSSCYSLTRVDILAGITFMGYDVFSGCNALTIYCLNESMPDGWNSTWNGKCPVVWNCTTTDTAQDGMIYAIITGVRYSLSSDGTATVVGQPVDIYEATIPSSVTYNEVSYTVTGVAEKAFYKCENLFYVSLPSVSFIGKHAFYECNSLTSIRVPESVTSMGSEAFRDCRCLTVYCEAETKSEAWPSNWVSSSTPVVWDCNDNDEAINGNIYTVYNGIRYALNDGVAIVVKQPISIVDANIASVVEYKGISYAVTNITSNAFQLCSQLRSVTVSEGVKNVGDHAFSWCTNLREVYIPSSVTKIDYNAFYECDALEFVIIDSASVIDSITCGSDSGHLLYGESVKVVLTCKEVDADSYIATTFSNKEEVKLNGKEYFSYSKVAHDWEDYEVEAQACHDGSEGENGFDGKKCSICGLTSGENIEFEHVYDKQVVDNLYKASEATCTQEETYYYSCACGKAGEDLTFKSGAPNGHTFDQQVVSLDYKAGEATCTQEATYYYSCACGEKGTETFKDGSVLDHDYSTEWGKDGDNHWHECDCGEKSDEAAHEWNEGEITTSPTVEEKGEKTYTCSVCGQTRTEEMDKLEPENPEQGGNNPENPEQGGDNPPQEETPVEPDGNNGGALGCGTIGFGAGSNGGGMGGLMILPILIALSLFVKKRIKAQNR